MKRTASWASLLVALAGCPDKPSLPDPPDLGPVADLTADLTPDLTPDDLWRAACVDGPPPAAPDLAPGADLTVAARCDDFVRNQHETGVDCGGECPKCAGASCTTAGECTGGRCHEGACAGCSDGIKNADEADVDCGGRVCAACGARFGAACTGASACASGLCEGSLCRAPASCSNRVRDGWETDVDCGGPVCSACAAGKRCRADVECLSFRCAAGRCSSCGDGRFNGDESGVDCGGSCEACAVGDSCRSTSDCALGLCEGGTCRVLPSRCSNGVWDCAESDVDCGGVCRRCGERRRCAANDDCLSGRCVASRCTAPDCPTPGLYRAADGGCGCDPRSCTGCCDWRIGAACWTYELPDQCGTEGVPCDRCFSSHGSRTCYRGRCIVFPDWCLGCSSPTNGVCVSVTGPLGCGKKYQICQVCDEGQLCEDGVCK